MIAGILGQRGCGKSTLFKSFVRNNPRVLVLDPLGEHAALGLVVSTSRDFRRYWRRQYRRKWRIILQPHEMLEHIRRQLPSPAQELEQVPAKVLEPYTRIVKDHSKACLLAIDEVGHFGTAWKCDPQIEYLAHYGRHRGVSLVWCARRPQEVPKVLRSQADALYVFRTTEPSDLRQLEERMGRQATRELLDLPERVALLWRPGQPTKLVRTELYE